MATVVSLDDRQVKRYWDLLQKRTIPKAKQQSMQSIANRGRAGAVAYVANRTRVSRRKIIKRMFVGKQRRGGKRGDLAFWFYHRPIPWISLNGRQTLTGAQSSVGTAQDAFRAQDPKGRWQIFQRLSSRNYPIRVLQVRLKPHAKAAQEIFKRGARRGWKKTFDAKMKKELALINIKAR